MRSLPSMTLLALTACAASPAQSPVPARLTNVDDAARAALSHAVAQALGGRKITLADDALTQSSRLLLEPARATAANGRPLQGRETRAPEAFRLFKQSDDCVLVHERTGKEFVLEGAHCESVRE